MNESVKQRQTHRHREQTCGCRGAGVGRAGVEFGAQMQSVALRVDKQHRPAGQPRELQSLPCDKPQWVRMRN